MWCGKAATLALLVDHRSSSTPFPATNHFKRFFFTLHSQHFTGIDFAPSRQITEGSRFFEHVRAILRFSRRRRSRCPGRALDRRVVGSVLRGRPCRELALPFVLGVRVFGAAGWAFGPRVVGVTFHLVLSCSNFCRHTSGAASFRLVRKLFRDGRDVIAPLRIRLLLEQLLDAILERGGVGLLDRGNGLSNLVLESCLAQDPLSER